MNAQKNMNFGSESDTEGALLTLNKDLTTGY